MLIHPSSGACDLFVELFHGLYCSGSMRVGVTLWFGWDGVVSVSRVWSPALPDFLSSSGSGTGSTQPREVNWGATWMKKSSGSRSKKNRRLTAVGTRCADHVTPLYPQKLTLTSPTGGGRSVGIVRVRTKATEFSFRWCRMVKAVCLNHRVLFQGITSMWPGWKRGTADIC